MLPPAVVEQQAKLGVSAEESKAERLKRQQARFRDRGGAFVPSNSNPLVDILLARTVSGESPSKAWACPKDVLAKRLSPSKARQDVAGNSNSKPLAPGNGSSKLVEPEVGKQPPPKRRGTAKRRKKAHDIDPNTEQLPSTKFKSNSTLKGKGKQPTVMSSPDGNPKRKPQPKANTKLKSAKDVVRIPVSDDETLVEVPRKTKSNPKKNVRHEDDDETDDDAPIIRKRTISCADGSIASGTRTVKRAKAVKAVGTRNSKKAIKDAEETVQEPCPKVTARKRPVSHDEREEVVAAPANSYSTSAKPKVTIRAEPELRPSKDARKGEKLKAPTKGKSKVRSESAQDISEPLEGDGDDTRPPVHVSKSKKRKKGEDNYDDRPRKVVKFSEIPLLQSSSHKLKENQSDKTRVPESGVKDEPDEPRSKLATKPSSRRKGPPREVLERIKAVAARHLRCVDSEPDELDCLS